MKDPRAQLTPQMATYDNIGRSWLPYLMFFQPANLASEVLSTDRYGFRVTWQGERTIRDFEIDEGRSVNLLVGGSTVFGVGASNDRQTLPSILNEPNGHEADGDALGDNATWLNFGGRAFFSTQELLLFLTYRGRLPNIQRVVLLSGLNNLVIFHLASRYARDHGSFFSANAFYDAIANLERADQPALQRFLQKLVESFSGSEVDESPRPEIDDLMFTWDRDLANWKVLCDALNIRLSYVLQPYADWIPRKPSREEELLFNELDRLDPDWQRIRDMELGREKYHQYCRELGSCCAKRGIGFYDMNELLAKREVEERWLFVDRVHLTDDGHRLVAEILREEVLGL